MMVVSIPVFLDAVHCEDIVKTRREESCEASKELAYCDDWH